MSVRYTFRETPEFGHLVAIAVQDVSLPHLRTPSDFFREGAKKLLEETLTDFPGYEQVAKLMKYSRLQDAATAVRAMQMKVMSGGTTQISVADLDDVLRRLG
jgi:hypothetical protein